MKITEIEKLNQLISRTDMSGNEKVKWLTDFIDKHVMESNLLVTRYVYKVLTTGARTNFNKKHKDCALVANVLGMARNFTNK